MRKGSVQVPGRPRLDATGLIALLVLAGTLSPTSLWAGGTEVLIDPFLLPPGASITIEWMVMINNPVAPGTITVMNQGAVVGVNFTTVLTDDPDRRSRRPDGDIRAGASRPRGRQERLHRSGRRRQPVQLHPRRH